MRIRIYLLGLTCCLLFSGTAGAQVSQPSEASIEFFESRIRPALVKYCYQCHSLEHGDSRAGLLVDTRAGLLEGGDSGPAVVPHQLDESLLWDAINWDGYEMPPSQPMPDDLIADFKTWIEMGAPDPRSRELLTHQSKITDRDIEAGQQHWAFQSPVPQTGTTIDTLVADRLQAADLQCAPPAEARDLLRRLNYGLVGLPPTPREIKAFEKAFKKDADAAIVAKTDQLLKQPQYGERWGRHWLDVARYAESAGVINMTFPHAWRYRDYVFDSFNNDTPYDQFLTEQIAGDLLPIESEAQFQKNLIATGFLAVGAKRLNEKNPRVYDADLIDEQIDAVTQATMGMTVACARCHDHKFDPIPTRDYYALAGIFGSTKTFYGTVGGQQNHRPGDLLELPIKNSQQKGSRSSAELKAQLKKLDEKKQELLDAVAAGGERVRIDFLKLRNRRQRVEGELATLNSDGTKKTVAMGVQDAAEISNAHILIGGEVDYQAQEVQRGFLQVLKEVNFEVTDDTSSGRLELAQAIASPDNPLTARVMVNRIWMHLLGDPLVGTPNNFGMSGMAPENQQLLDYLAGRFVKQGWSVKSLIREIVSSDTYRRSAQFIEANHAVDPDNKLLWRASPRLLDAESLRDTVLMAAGQLDLQRPAGSEVSQIGDTHFDRTGGQRVFDDNPLYRSVYLPVVRNGLNESMSLFDFPDPSASNAARSNSIVPTQALFMLNSEFAATQSRAMASQLVKQYRTTELQVKNAFWQLYGRPATDVEIEASKQFFNDFVSAARPIVTPPSVDNPSRRMNRRGGKRSRDSDSMPNRKRNRRKQPVAETANNTPPLSPDIAKLAAFCQTLMASAEFRILN